MNCIEETVELSMLKCIVHGDLTKGEQEVTLSYRFLIGAIERIELEKGYLVSKSSDENTVVYQIQEIHEQSARVKKVGEIKYNDILREHRKSLTLKQIKSNEYADPIKGAIYLIPL